MDEDLYINNMKAELAFTQKLELEKEKFEVVTEYDDLVITETDYSRTQR